MGSSRRSSSWPRNTCWPRAKATPCKHTACARPRPTGCATRPAPAGRWRGSAPRARHAGGRLDQHHQRVPACRGRPAPQRHRCGTPARVGLTCVAPLKNSPPSEWAGGPKAAPWGEVWSRDASLSQRLHWPRSDRSSSTTPAGPYEPTIDMRGGLAAGFAGRKPPLELFRGDNAFGCKIPECRQPLASA